MGGLLGCSLAAILLAGTGMGAHPVETTIQDDATLLHRSDGAVRRAAAQIQQLGADRVRITAGWSVLAPGAHSAKRPDFDATDTRSYPQEHFRALDRAVRAVTAEGLDVQLDLAFWAPRWAVRRGSPNRDRHRRAPDAKAFGEFAGAVARRYSGHFTDPAAGVVLKLPAVKLYTTWNEPNFPFFLQPQWRRTKHGFRAYSPHLYRPMHEQAYAQIKAADRANRVLIGGLAAAGSSHRGRGAVAPMEFLRTLACVNRRLAPLRVKECRGAGVLHADGFAMHPYSVGVAPGVGARDPDDIYLADLDRLELLLSQLYHQGRTDSEWPVYVTEYGYETRPPDPHARFTPEQQARYLSWATYLAHTQPSVRMFAQFLLRDIRFPRNRPGRDYQTGLFYANGEAKPAALSFKLPFFASAADAPDGSRGLVLFGGVRPGTGRRIVRIERRAPGAELWEPVPTIGDTCDEASGAFLTDGDGFFRRTAAWMGPGQYRLGWQHGSFVEYGPAVPVAEKSLIEG